MPEINDYQKDSEELRIKIEDLVTDFVLKYPNVITTILVDVFYESDAIPETYATVYIEGVIMNISPARRQHLEGEGNDT